MSLTSVSADPPSHRPRATAVVDGIAGLSPDLLPGLRVGEVDQPVLCEPRMQRDVEQTAERCSGCRIGSAGKPESGVGSRTPLRMTCILPLRPGHQHVATRHERDAPRVIDAFVTTLTRNRFGPLPYSHGPSPSGVRRGRRGAPPRRARGPGAAPVTLTWRRTARCWRLLRDTVDTGERHENARTRQQQPVRARQEMKACSTQCSLK